VGVATLIISNLTIWVLKAPVLLLLGRIFGAHRWFIRTCYTTLAVSLLVIINLDPRDRAEQDSGSHRGRQQTGFTALFFAVQAGNTELVRFIPEQVAFPELSASPGESLREIAEKMDFTEVIRVLDEFSGQQSL
jgi:hypothetical protein